MFIWFREGIICWGRRTKFIVITSLQRVALDLFISRHTQMICFRYSSLFPLWHLSWIQHQPFLRNDNIYPSSVCLMKYVEDFESKINVRNSGFSLSLHRALLSGPATLSYLFWWGNRRAGLQRPKAFHARNVATQRDFYSYYWLFVEFLIATI